MQRFFEWFGRTFKQFAIIPIQAMRAEN